MNAHVLAAHASDPAVDDYDDCECALEAVWQDWMAEFDYCALEPDEY